MNNPVAKRALAISLIFILAAAGAASARELRAQESRPAGKLLNPWNVAALRSVTSCAISADGQSVAYTLSVPRNPLKDEDGPAWSELWVANVKNGECVPYVSGEGNVTQVEWMPGGENISFIMKRGKDKFKSIYTIPRRGGEARLSMAWKTDIQQYSWSTDGSRVAIVAADAEPEPVRKDKEKFKQEVYEEDARASRVWLARNIGAQVITNAAPMDAGGHVTAIKWSPAGDRIAVAVAPTPLMDDVMMRSKVKLLPLDSEKPQITIPTEGKLGQFEWNTDGSFISVIAASDIHDPHAGSLRVFDVATGKININSASSEVQSDAVQLLWRAKDSIAVLWDSSAFSGLGGNKFNSYEGVRKPAYADHLVITSFSLSPAANLAAVVAQLPSHPPELYVFPLSEDGSVVRLTNSNPELKNLRLAQQDYVSYKSRDGLDLQGVLIHPLEEKAGEKYPLIVVVHGGPEAHNRNGWLTNYSNPGQIAAARGYAVFYPNYRGSTGRGPAFARLGQGDAAGAEFNDLIDGIDYLIKTGLVDGAKVGVTGGSYGGYATAWCATKFSDRFAAGVMFVGISNKVSKVGSTDIPEEEFLVHARHRVWDDYEFFLKRSPIYYADQCRTPLLIMGGKDDPRVDPSQSKEMYRHLKMRGKAPVRLVQYPGEQHGNAKASSRLDYSLRMMQWFDHYLKGPGGDPPDPRIPHEEPAAK